MAASKSSQALLQSSHGVAPHLDSHDAQFPRLSFSDVPPRFSAKHSSVEEMQQATRWLVKVVQPSAMFTGSSHRRPKSKHPSRSNLDRFWNNIKFGRDREPPLRLRSN